MTGLIIIRTVTSVVRAGNVTRHIIHMYTYQNPDSAAYTPPSRGLLTVPTQPRTISFQQGPGARDILTAF